MIKVLKPGNTTKEVTCKNCTALLSYNKSDIKLSYGEAFDYSWETKYIICPECKNKIILQIIKY
jgi:RNase P subunit RPR2